MYSIEIDKLMDEDDFLLDPTLPLILDGPPHIIPELQMPPSTPLMKEAFESLLAKYTIFVESKVREEREEVARLEIKK